VQSVHRTLSLPQSSRPVLGADLNLSELVRRPTGLSENIADRGGDSAVAEPFSCPAGWPMYAGIMFSRPRTLPAGFIPPCLPTKAPSPPAGAAWLHEIKHDGFRVIARKGAALIKKESTTKANGVQFASFGTDEIALRVRRSIRFSLLVQTRWSRADHRHKGRYVYVPCNCGRGV
jgi:hypothetical protein